MYNLVIRMCTSSPLLAPRLKILNENLPPRRGSNPGPAETEADMLPSEPAWRASYEIVTDITIWGQLWNPALFEKASHNNGYK